MHIVIKVVLSISLLFSILSCNHSQYNSLQQRSDTTYFLEGDTLFSNQDFKIFVGRRIVIGKASGERDWYNSISFRSGANWPMVFLKKMETEQNLEYQMDPSIRERDKIKDYLHQGDTLVITRIKRFGKERFGYWYRITMAPKPGLSLHFHCNIVDALQTKEVLLPEI